MRKFDIKLGECSEDAHCFIGKEEKCCCGETTQERRVVENLRTQLAASKAREARLESALQKIDEPMKYHHWEEDPYTRAGCFQFVAHEALKADSDGIETLAAIREAMVELETFEECNCDRAGAYKSLCGLHTALHKLKEVFGEPR